MLPPDNSTQFELSNVTSDKSATAMEAMTNVKTTNMNIWKMRFIVYNLGIYYIFLISPSHTLSRNLHNISRETRFRQ